MKRLNWNQALKRHHRLSDRIRPITNPLIEAFDLAHFCYFSVDEDGNSAALSTYPAWMECYMNQSLFRFNPFLKSPKIIPSGIYLSRGIKDTHYVRSRKLAETFGIQDSLTILMNTKSKLTGFSFGFKTALYNPLINEIPLLKSYCNFFQEEASKSITDLESEPVNVLPVLGNFFRQSTEDFQSGKHLRTTLLSLMGIHNPRLSRREEECLQLYISGENARSIAEKLNLSKRTIESYLDNIKVKLDCFNKTELIKKGKILLESSYFIR